MHRVRARHNLLPSSFAVLRIHPLEAGGHAQVVTPDTLAAVRAWAHRKR